MALSLETIKAKLLEQQAKKERAQSGSFGGDNGVYPFWNNPEGSTAKLRFLPDSDESNDFFWVERLIIKLPFPGVKGQDTTKPVTVQVPCMDMWKPGSCPIAAETRPWWKDKTLEDMARKYWRKKSFIFQGFVNSNPNKDDQQPENPIRRFIINPSIFDIIKTVLMQASLQYSPTDYEHGRDFYLTKTSKGGYNNYSSSTWDMSERALTQDEKGAVEQHGLFNLSSFLPKKPDEKALAAIMEMFSASVQDELYDPERWGQYYRPVGVRIEGVSETPSELEDEPPFTGGKSTVSSNPKPTVAAPVKPTVALKPESSEPKASTKSPEDILAMIKARAQK